MIGESRQVRVVLALGSNLGRRFDLLQAAVDRLLDGTGDVTGVAVSRVYETVPVGGPEQPDYLNAVMVIDTSLPPLGLLRRCQAVEDTLGRVRKQRWGARTIDVDIVVYGNLRSSDPRLTLPHPRAYERCFVLVPWSDIDVDAELPGHGRIADMCKGLDVSGIRPTELRLQVPTGRAFPRQSDGHT